MRVSKTTLQSSLISLCLLGATLLIAEAYISYRQKEPVNERIASTLLEVQEEVSFHPEQTVMAPDIPTEQLEPPIPTADIQIVPRIAAADVVRAPRVTTTTVLEFSNVSIKHDLQVSPNMPRVRVVPEVVTYSNIPTVASLGGVVFSTSAPPVIPKVGKSVIDTYIRVARFPMKPKGLSIIKIITVADSGLTDVAHQISSEA